MILKAAWVLPVTGAPIRNGAVRIAADHIVGVGPAETLEGQGEPTTDLGTVILMPGLINAHTHLELTCYADQLAPGPFWSWLPELVVRRAAPGQIEREGRGVHDGAWQSLRVGVTCVGDISRRNVHWRALKAIPIRKVCYVELLSLADDPPRNPDELRAAVAEVEEDELLTVGVTPHAPYSVPAEQIQAALRLATELHRPWCTHWAETREERAFLLGDTGALPGYMRDLLAQCQLRSPGLSAIEFLEQCARDARPGMLAHFNYAQPGDAERLAAAGHVVVYCPRAHHFFGHAPHPWRSLMSAGVTVAIGTDSSASNENLALLGELRFVCKHTPDPPPAELLLQTITTHAARALGLDGQIGALETGRLADLAAFACSSAVDKPVADLIERAPAAAGVWVAGERVI